MQAGSLVETVGNFDSVRLFWGYNYPKKGDVLTISNLEPHHNEECRAKGIMLLYFEELPDLVGVCDKNMKDEPNFIELQPPMDLEFVKEMQMLNPVKSIYE